MAGRKGSPQASARNSGWVAKPKPGWNGIVNCVVPEVHEPTLLRYSLQDDGGGDITEVTYSLEPHAGGTRFTYDHTGFSGIGGFVSRSYLAASVARS